MFTLQVGFMSPTFVGIVPSIEMVIFCAVGGRLSLPGVVYGALLVNAAKSYLSESFPQLWTILMGAVFIGVVMGFQWDWQVCSKVMVLPLKRRSCHC